MKEYDITPDNLALMMMYGLGEFSVIDNFLADYNQEIEKLRQKGKKKIIRKVSKWVE